MVETTVVLEKGDGGDGAGGGGGGGGGGGENGGENNENKVVVVTEIPIPPVAEVPTWRVDYLPTFRESPEYIRSRGGKEGGGVDLFFRNFFRGGRCRGFFFPEKKKKENSFLFFLFYPIQNPQRH